MRLLPVNSVSFGAKIKGDYSKVQKTSYNAGYPLSYILKIDERLHQLFPQKGDTIKFVDGTKEVFHECGHSHNVPNRSIRLIRNHREVDIEPVELFKKPLLNLFDEIFAYKRLGEKHAEKYTSELRMLNKRQFLLAYYQAALRLAKRVNG